MSSQILLLLIVIATTAFYGGRCDNDIDYVVINNSPDTPGGGRFMDEIGVDFTRSKMSAATDFIFDIFQQRNNASQRRGYKQVKLFINKFSASQVAYTGGNEVYFSAEFIETYAGGDLKKEFTGVLYREMAHVWQWNGAGKAPAGIVEGIAAYVRVKADLAPDYWVKPGGGDRWDQGYDVAGRFVEYCEGVRKGFVAEMNRKMKDGYSEGYFSQVMGGKSVGQVWGEYKKKYTKVPRGRN
ncbi:hypothetical protein LINGRAHAP2_LOCUS35651 [Linum grandiflorum]